MGIGHGSRGKLQSLATLPVTELWGECPWQGLLPVRAMGGTSTLTPAPGEAFPCTPLMRPARQWLLPGRHRQLWRDRRNANQYGALATGNRRKKPCGDCNRCGSSARAGVIMGAARALSRVPALPPRSGFPQPRSLLSGAGFVLFSASGGKDHQLFLSVKCRAHLGCSLNSNNNNAVAPDKAFARSTALARAAANC